MTITNDVVDNRNDNNRYTTVCGNFKKKEKKKNRLHKTTTTVQTQILSIKWSAREHHNHKGKTGVAIEDAHVEEMTAIGCCLSLFLSIFFVCFFFGEINNLKMEMQ